MGRKVFRWVTIALFALTLWMGYANVLSDDTEVRALARAKMGEVAGCGADCKVENLRGERGMFGETIAYDVLPSRAGGARGGTHTIVCRRQYIAFGAWACAPQ